VRAELSGSGQPKPNVQGAKNQPARGDSVPVFRWAPFLPKRSGGRFGTRTSNQRGSPGIAERISALMLSTHWMFSARLADDQPLTSSTSESEERAGVLRQRLDPRTLSQVLRPREVDRPRRIGTRVHRSTATSDRTRRLPLATCCGGLGPVQVPVS